MSNMTLEALVSNVQNMYQAQHQRYASSASTSAAAAAAASGGGGGGEANYPDIFNTLVQNLNVLQDNAHNLLDNVLPIFVLPEFTLANMVVLYACASQPVADTGAASATSSQSSQSASTSGAASGGSRAARLGSKDSPTTASQHHTPIDQDKLFHQVEICIGQADERQVGVGSSVFAELCHFYTNTLCQQQQQQQQPQLRRSLLIIDSAIKKLQVDANTGKLNFNLLTSVHADLLQLSLIAQNFTLATQLLANDTLDLWRPTTGYFDAKHLLAYFYYAGCIQAVLKSFDASLFYLEQVLTTPAQVISQIMIDAYKKFLLISLISNGRVPQLPKYTSRLILNQIKPISGIYHELAAAFVAYDHEKLMSVSHKYQDTFQKDGNVGLVKQLHQSFYKKNIQKLTKTFVTLSLADMATKVKLASARHAETLIVNMIRDGEIFASINQKDGMVTFHDNPEKYDNPALMEQLTKQMFTCIETDKQIREMDRQITVHPQYIQKIQTNAIIEKL